MPRLIIHDLPKNSELSNNEIQNVYGGVAVLGESTGSVSLGFPDVCFVPTSNLSSVPIPYNNLPTTGTTSTTKVVATKEQ